MHFCQRDLHKYFWLNYSLLSFKNFIAIGKAEHHFITHLALFQRPDLFVEIHGMMLLKIIFLRQINPFCFEVIFIILKISFVCNQVHASVTEVTK